MFSTASGFMRISIDNNLTMKIKIDIFDFHGILFA